MDDDDLLREILLRLPALPSSLPHASLVCKRWRCLVSDPGFIRRFRTHHGKPPLLGLFRFLRPDLGITDLRRLCFTPTLDPPDHIPAARFSPDRRRGERCSFHGYRHGLALILNHTRQEAIVWNPDTGDQRCVSFPPAVVSRQRESFRDETLHGTILGNDNSQLSPFKLVLVWYAGGHQAPYACLYQSESGLWGNVVSTSAYAPWTPWTASSVMVGNALCWLLCGGHILEFDVETQTLAVIKKPVGLFSDSNFQILRTEDNEHGLALVSGLTDIQLWERKANFNGIVGWVLQKTIELDKLLSVKPSVLNVGARILAFAEDANAIVVWLQDDGVFLIQLESLQFKKISEITGASPWYPYASFFTADRGIGGGANGV
ncbi:hypothetical protein ACP70R_020705 [Stipagrostis hirtigluma subsp. patula]